MLWPLDSLGWRYGCRLITSRQWDDGSYSLRGKFTQRLKCSFGIDVSACSEIRPQGKAVARQGCSGVVALLLSQAVLARCS